MNASREVAQPLQGDRQRVRDIRQLQSDLLSGFRKSLADRSKPQGYRDELLLDPIVEISFELSTCSV